MAQQGCVRFEVEVRGKETISVDDDSAFVTASGAACGGVRPVLAGTPVYDGPADRVRLPLALANQTAQPFRAPARLYGWEDSLTVLEAPGLAQNEWTADYLNFVNSDSALDATDPRLPGAVLWRYDTLLAAQPPRDELAAGASSQVRWVELAVHSGVLKFQLVLYAEAADADTSRPAIPLTGLFPYDSTIVIPPQGDTVNVFFRNIIGIRFDDSTSGTTIRSLFQRYQAEIIGGLTNAKEYIIRVPDPGSSWEAYDALLRRLNEEEIGVDYASPMSYRSGITFHSKVADADTSRPAVPPLGIFPRDTTIVIAPPGDTMNVFYRNIFVIRFDDTTSGRTIRSLFQRYGAEIVSGGPAQQEYFVRVPAPGASWEAYEALKRRLNEDESGVDYAAPVHRRSGITFQVKAAVADTSRPAIPPTGMFPRDTTIVISPPWDTATVFYRNILAIRFDDSTSGTTIRQLFQICRAEIIGGLSSARAYIVRVPDPGASWEAYEALKRRLNDQEAGVTYASPVSRRSGITFHAKVADADTSRPATPPTGAFPYDSTVVITQPGDTENVFYRNIVGIRFDDSTSGVTIRDVFRRYRAEIIGGLTRAKEYIVEVPDPGPRWAAYDALMRKLNMEPGVRYAAPVGDRSGITFH